jgi:hypothetical protein
MQNAKLKGKFENGKFKTGYGTLDLNVCCTWGTLKSFTGIF